MMGFDQKGQAKELKESDKVSGHKYDDEEEEEELAEVSSLSAAAVSARSWDCVCLQMGSWAHSEVSF